MVFSICIIFAIDRPFYEPRIFLPRINGGTTAPSTSNVFSTIGIISAFSFEDRMEDT